MHSIDLLINELQLEPLAEGGRFQRIYQSNMKDANGRRYGAAIYYLLQAPEYSCFHRIDCDELWHFYAGNPLMLYQIDPNGQLTETILGNPLTTPQAKPVAIVANGTWFAASIIDNAGFSLVGCTTTPEFVYETYEIGKREVLLAEFSQHANLIRKLTINQ